MLPAPLWRGFLLPPTLLLEPQKGRDLPLVFGCFILTFVPEVLAPRFSGASFIVCVPFFIKGPVPFLHRRDSVIAWHMIPFVPIAYAVLALLAWRYDARERRAYEATLSEAEKRQFRALRRVHPAKWRAAIALKQSECLTTAAHDAAPRPRKIRPKSTAQHANNGGNTPA
jgi:hypothetical protein